MLFKKRKLISYFLLFVAFFALAAGCGQTAAKSKADRKIELAVKYLSEDKFEEAVLAYNDSIKIDPKNVSGYKGLGKAYTMQGRYDEAERIYRQGLNTVKETDQLKLCLAGLYVDKGMPDRAVDAYNELIRTSPSYLPAYEALVRQLIAQGSTYEAIPLLVSFTESNTNNDRGYYLLADAYLREGDRESAVEALLKSLELNVDQDAAFMLVDRLFNRNWRSIIDYGSKILPQNEKAGSILKLYGYYKSKQYDKVIDEYRALSDKGSPSNKAMVLGALSYLGINDQKTADALIAKVSANMDKNASLYADVAEYHLNRGNAEKAQNTALRGLQFNNIDIDIIKALFDIAANKNDNSRKYYVYLLYSLDPGSVKQVNEKMNEYGIPAESIMKSSYAPGGATVVKKDGGDEKDEQGEQGDMLTSTVVVMDISSSMNDNWSGGRKIDSSKKAATQMMSLIGQENSVFGPRHEVSLISFSDRATLELPTTIDIEQAKQTVGKLDTQSSTNLGAALEMANLQLDQVSAGKKLVVVLSDGNSNRGMSADEMLAGPVTQAQEKGYVIYTIGFGEKAQIDESFLEKIAQNTGGSYYYANGGYELQNVYLKLRHQGAGQIIAEYKGPISQGETKEVGKVQVSSKMGQIHSTLNWGGSDLDLTLKDPRGKIVDEKYPGAKIYNDKPRYVIVENPAPGEWTAIAYGREVPEGSLTYDFIASSREKEASEYAGLAVLGLMLIIGLSVVIIIIRVNKRYCRGCGLRKEKGSLFCPECGQSYRKK